MPAMTLSDPLYGVFQMCVYNPLYACYAKADKKATSNNFHCLLRTRTVCVYKLKKLWLIRLGYLFEVKYKFSVVEKKSALGSPFTLRLLSCESAERGSAERRQCQQLCLLGH